MSGYDRPVAAIQLTAPSAIVGWWLGGRPGLAAPEAVARGSLNR